MRGRILYGSDNSIYIIKEVTPAWRCRLNKDRGVRCEIHCYSRVPIALLLGFVSTASADRRNYPVEPKRPSIQHANYILQVWLGRVPNAHGRTNDTPNPDTGSDGRTDLEGDLG